MEITEETLAKVKKVARDSFEEGKVRDVELRLRTNFDGRTQIKVRVIVEPGTRKSDFKGSLAFFPISIACAFQDVDIDCSPEVEIGTMDETENFDKDLGPEVLSSKSELEEHSEYFQRQVYQSLQEIVEGGYGVEVEFANGRMRVRLSDEIDTCVCNNYNH